jgi:Domain of unknown function (DUF4360)
MKKLVLFLVIFSAASASNLGWGSDSPDDVQLGQPAYGGNGCPAGTASAVLSPDAKELSILFDQYVAQAGGSTGLTLDRKSCNVAIPVHVPSGWSVSILQFDYRGFNDIPAGASSRFSVSYFFAGAQGPTYAKTFAGPLSDDYLLSNVLAATAYVWSPCGADTILRTNTSMIAQTNRYQQQTMATVDSIDIKAGLVYQLQWRRCSANQRSAGSIDLN